MKKPLKVIRNVVLALMGLLLVILVALQVLLRPSVLTGLVNNFAAGYVEGEIGFQEIKAHVIKSFPYVNIEASNFAITYPHARYAAWDQVYPDKARRFSLLKAGLGRDSLQVDTLASFRKLEVSVNYLAFLSSREIHVHKLELERPRIFAHYYDSTAANWDILRLGGDAKDSSETNESSGPLRIKLNKIRLTDRPFIVFTNPKDTLHGMFAMKQLSLDGKVDSREWDRTEAVFSMDSLFISGRLPADTVALRLDFLRIQAKDRSVKLDASAAARLATGKYGRLRVPIGLQAKGSFPQRKDGCMEVDFERLGLQLSTLEMEGKGSVIQRPECWDLDLEAAIQDCPLGQLIDEYENNIPSLKKLNTNAKLSASAQVKGSYGGGNMPTVNAQINIPLSTIDYEGLGRKGRLALDASVTTDDLQAIDASVQRLLVDIAGARIDGKLDVKDALGEDPLISLNASIRARVDSLTRAFTAEKGITGTGRIDARLNGKARLSQLDMVHIGAASVNCDLTAQDLLVEMPEDSIHASLPKLEANLSTRGNQIDRNIRKGARVLALKAQADTLDVSLKDMFVRGGGVLLLMQNSADILKGGRELTPFMGLLKVKNLRLRDGEGLGLGLHDNTETFRIAPATKQRPTPRLTLTSKSGKLRVRSGANMFSLRDFQFDVSAARHQARPRNNARREHLLDSLQRVYPGVPRDSLFRKAHMSRLAREQKDAFAASDININLSQSLREYARNWDFSGKINLPGARIFMPSFPLRTSLSDVNGTFSSDTLNLQGIKVKSGASDLSAQACLTGLRRALVGRGKSKFKLKADVQSNYIDANELMRAYAYYSTYQAPETLSDASDTAVEEAISQAALPDTVGSKLIVIPSNLEVDFSLEASGIKYDSLLVSWAAADVVMRDRTLQITNALAASNMGDIYFEGFYSTRSKDDIKAGFDLNLVDITAEKVITLFPAVDTLMPMLSSFAGDLDCELAATSAIDTCMNLVLPSIDGIMKISGKDLSLKESKEFTKLAKLLMFKDKSKAQIDNMSVAGVVHDNQLEIFPFVLDVDRYLFAASGIQNLNKNFEYHISVIKSPLLFKFGVNAWGDHFDDIHYTLTKAKYRSPNVPVYTKQLDTIQYSLVAAIHNIFELGVEKAMEENRSGMSISAAAQEAPQGALSKEEVMASMQGMETLQEDVVNRVTSRREALKQEVLRLEQEAADQKKE